jgi:hypothetical protein
LLPWEKESLKQLCMQNNWDRHETEQEFDGALNEAEEMALAARPLEIADVREFQQYIGDLIARRSDQQEVLQELYDSPELPYEGLLSFAYPLFVADDEELDYFLGKLIHSAGKAIGGVAKTIGKGVSAIDKVVPVSMIVSANPIGMAFRAGLGAAQAAAEGRNVFQGAIRNIAGDPWTRFVVDTGMATARGENIVKAAQKAAQAGIGDVRKSLQFAAMVAPFIPGIGTGVAAALGAANALASGQPITEALIAAARTALPGGASLKLRSTRR